MEDVQNPSVCAHIENPRLFASTDVEMSKYKGYNYKTYLYMYRNAYT